MVWDIACASKILWMPNVYFWYSVNYSYVSVCLSIIPMSQYFLRVSIIPMAQLVGVVEVSCLSVVSVQRISTIPQNS